MDNEKWVLCPICNNKTRTKVRPDTVLENFPLFCPKYKRETVISIKELEVVAVTIPHHKRKTEIKSLGRLSTFGLNRLVCHKAKQAEAVNGGRSPFILTVDCCCLFCYLPYPRSE